MKLSKKLLSLLLCVVMVLGTVAIGGDGIDELLNIFSVNVSAYSNWSEAYREFTVGNRYKNFDVDYDKNIVPEPFDSNEERIGLFLYDMDNDGVPELFMSNGFLGRETAYSYIFTVSDGNIKYLDTVYHSIGYTNNSKYKGVFTISYYGYTFYFEKSGLKINRKDVAFVDKENGRKVTVYNQELNNCKIEYFNEVNLSELRIMGWSAFCSKYGFKTTDNQTTGKSDSISYSKPILKYTGKDNSVLKDFLQSCYFLGYYNTGSYFAFDSNEVTTYTLMNNLLSSKKYSYFSDIDYVEDYSGKSSDPRKIYGYAYRKTNASQLNWLLKNVFNYNEQSIRKMKDNGESKVAQNKFDGFYEEGGYYYCSAADGIGSSSGIKTIINSSTEINGYTYVEYTVEEYEYYDLKKLTGSTKLYAQLKYKSSDGQNYWSLYKNANKKFWDEDKVEKEDGTGKYKIEYSDGKSDVFEYNLDYYIDKTDSCTYSPELAYMLMSVANAAYSEKTVNKMFSTLGFEKTYTSTETYKEDDETKWSEGKIRYGLGTKKTDNGKTLVLVDIAGTNGEQQKLSGEWRSDVDLGFDGQAASTGYNQEFEQAADYLLEGLNSFISTNKIDKSEAIFVVTGHSSGAAVGNIVTCKLDVKKTNIYNYNFACPDVALETGEYWNAGGAHDNIFNISSNQDLVSMVPGVLGDMFATDSVNRWGKYGKSLWFSDDWSDSQYDGISLPSHNPSNYLEYFRKLKPESELRNFEQMKTSIPNPAKYDGQLFGIFCPVDVKLTDDDGNVVAEIVNNEVKQREDNVFVIINQDHKIVFVFDDKHTNVELTGTDSGKMTLMMRTFYQNSWEIADQKDFKDVDIEKSRTVTTEWGGNASADEIELTEGVQPEGVIGNVLPKKGEGNTRTIIIVVAALVVVLAVLFAVFLIVRKKKNGSQEELSAVQDEENIVKAEPPVVERTAKTVNGSSGNGEITFVCTELFESGICDICKNEIAKPVSLEINSRGNEKKYTVCVSCAQKAIRKIKDMK